MPFYKVTSSAMLIEAEDATEAAMVAYRMFEDHHPHEFDVVGPDSEFIKVALSAERQEEAITIAFGSKREGRPGNENRKPSKAI